MRKSAIGDFIDLLSSFVRNEQKARRKILCFIQCLLAMCEKDMFYY